MESFEQRLREIVRASPWLRRALQSVRQSGPSGAFIAAGAVRDTVWNALTGRAMEGALGDVDVVYCDANEPVDGAQRHEAELRGAYPALCWEVTNQAWVHVWYAAKVGHEVAPLGSVLEGLATWPETATAVAVRLAADDQIELLAPFGVSDLFDLVVRHNPARASAATYRERSAQKLWARRWPELRILPAAAS